MAGINCQIPKILTVKEVADILRVHPSTVSRYAMAGELRSYVIGSRRLFKEEDIWAFFDNQADRRHAVTKEI
jgi:excisionase family DNA binding protein